MFHLMTANTGNVQEIQRFYDSLTDNIISSCSAAVRLDMVTRPPGLQVNNQPSRPLTVSSLLPHATKLTVLKFVVAVKDAGEGSCRPHPRAGAPRRSVTDRTRRLTGPLGDLGDLGEASLFSGFSEVFPLATGGVWPWRSYLQPPGLLCTSRPFAAQHFHHVSVITERGVCHVCNLHT